jgi:hypothetical protein
MSISPLSLGFSVLQQTGSAASRRQDFTQLANALQSGNLDRAQKAYANLEQLLGQTSSSPASASGSSSDPITNDLSALGQALSSGDVTHARSAFTQLQSDFQAGRSGAASGSTQSQVRPHHHHHAGTPGGGVPEVPTQIAGSPSSSSFAAAGKVNLIG